MSAKTKAPAYNAIYLVFSSLTIAAVKPTPELPLPVVYIALGEILAIFLSNCDLATPGSPTKAMLIYPLILMLSVEVYFVTPPAIISRSAFLTFYIP